MATLRSVLPPRSETEPRPRWMRLLLLLPLLAVFGAPTWLTPTPTIFGLAFVYWYQALWAVISAGLIYTVYRLEN